MSGTHWDNILSANIEGDAAASSFDNYVKSSKVCLNILSKFATLINLLFDVDEQAHGSVSQQRLGIF
jgi:hypothetical protein